MAATELPHNAEPYSQEMYEELEQRVSAYKSLLESHDQEVQTLTAKLKLVEAEKAEI